MKEFTLKDLYDHPIEVIWTDSLDNAKADFSTVYEGKYLIEEVDGESVEVTL